MGKKLLRDCKDNKAELGSIAILVFLALFVFSGLLSASKGMAYEFDKWSSETNLADAWVTPRSQKKSLVKMLLVNAGIADADGQFVLDTKVTSSTGTHLVRLDVKDSSHVSRPKIFVGETFKVDEPSSIWLDEDFAHTNHIDIGSIVHVELNGASIPLTVRGIINSPDYLGYTTADNDLVADHHKSGYAYSNPASMPLLAGKINSIEIKGYEGCDGSCLSRAVSRALGNEMVSVLNRTTNTQIAKFGDKVNSMRRLSLLFSALMVVLVVLTTVTTISRLVRQQRSTIGLMRALGFSKRSLELGYVSIGLIATIPCGVAGVLLGPPTLGKMFLDKQRFLFNMPYWSVRQDNASWMLLGGFALMSALSSMAPVAGIVHSSPAAILDSREVSANGRSRVNNRIIRFGSWLDWSWHWVIRDKMRSRAKECIGVVAVLGAITLVVASLGVQLSLSKTNEQTYGDTLRYTSQIQLARGYKSDNLAGIIQSLGNDYQNVEQLPISLKTAQHETNTTATVADSGLYLTLRDRRSQPIWLDNAGVYVSQGTASRLGITVGDSMSLDTQLFPRPIIVPVRGIVQISAPQGVFMSVGYWQQIGQEFRPSSIYVGKHARITRWVRNNPFVQEVTSLSTAKTDANQILDTFQSVLALLLVFAVILSWFILYNLGLLNFEEQYREYATMRILGFRISEIRSVILKSNFITWVLGTILGIPFSLWFLRIYVAMANSNTTQFYVYYSPVYLIVAASFILMNIVAIALMISRRIIKIDLSSALRNID